MVGYIFGGNTGLNYEDLQNRRAAADALAKRIMGQQPKNVGEGIGALLQGAAAGIGRYQADKGLKKGRDEASAQFNDILSKITGQPVPAGESASGGIPSTDAAAQVSATSPALGNGSYRDAIASIESAGSGDYAAIGPTNSKLGRPLGRYQIMEANVGPWSKEALGREVSADEFLKNPDLQDKVFDHRFQTYVNKYGPEGAAQAWLGGPGSVGKTDRKDVLGTSVGEYGSRFMNALGQQQVASLDPSAGMQSPQTAAQAIEAQAPLNGGSLSDEVAEYRTTPEYRAQFPGRQPASPAFDSSRFGDVATLPQNGDGRSALQAGLASQASAYAAPSPRAAGAPGGAAPMRVAEAAQVAPVASSQPAAPNPSQPPPMRAQPFQIDPQILQFLSSPFADEGQKQSVRMMLQQQMQAAQQAQAEQQWRSRQDYANQQEQNDPLRQAQIAEAKARANALQTPTRPITAEERQAWGITDNRPYAMTANGPEAIGGNGQTINVGGQIEARKQAAETLGLKADDPRYMGYVLNGELPKESQQQLTVTDKKAILEADDMVSSNQAAIKALTEAQGLSDQANAGWFADTRASLGNNLPDWMVPDAVSSPGSSQATTNYDNAVVGQALGQLKAIFGGAPTEGERKILLDLQGSSNMPRAAREEILTRAKAAAENRLRFNQERAASLRGGDYYKPNQEPNVQTNPPRTADEATGMPARATAERGPRVGAVEDGYRFKGGNPSDPNNWEQVR